MEECAVRVCLPLRHVITHTLEKLMCMSISESCEIRHSKDGTEVLKYLYLL